MRLSQVSLFVGLLAFSAAPVMAQKASTAARAQQLAKLEEELSSGDPNTRLAALEGAMESTSVAFRERALTLGLTSRDSNLRSVALRYAFCARPNLNLLHTLPEGYSPNGRYGTSVMSVKIQNCDPNTGRFEAIWTSIQRSLKLLARPGIISGQSVEFELASMNSNGRTLFDTCSISLRLQNNSSLVGRLSCPNSRFGPVSAQIDLR